MPVQDRKTRRRPADLRETILQTALRLFSERGYFNTSVHDIRREADHSIGAIYHYFDGKEAVAKALYDELAQQMTGVVERIMAEHSTAHDRCRAVVSHLFRLTETSPDTIGFMLQARHREFMPEEKPVCSSRPFQLMKSMVEEGIRRGEIRDLDPTLAAAILFGGPIRLIQLRLDQVIDQPLPELLAEAWDSAWRAVRA